MHPWLIRLLPITSAKFAKSKRRTDPDRSKWYVFVKLRPSLHAILTERCLAVLLLTVVVVSDIPLVVTLYLLATFLRYQWLRPTMQGEFLLADDQIKVRGISHTAPKFMLTFKHWLVAIQLSGRWHILWRDACDDDVYRRLIVAIKRQSQ